MSLELRTPMDYLGCILTRQNDSFLNWQAKNQNYKFIFQVILASFSCFWTSIVLGKLVYIR